MTSLAEFWRITQDNRERDLEKLSQPLMSEEEWQKTLDKAKPGPTVRIRLPTSFTVRHTKE